MIKKLLTSLLLSFICVSAWSQKEDRNSDYRNGRFYSSSETEFIFSFANVEMDSINHDNALRFSPVFNLTYRLNYDVTKFLSFDIGLGLRNVGFILNIIDNENDLKKKYRTYNFGLPVGIKIGDLNQKNPFFLFAGGEIEMPFHYKEKTFENGDKTGKITGWFSKRTDLFAQSVYAGVQLPQGFSIKFKYYLNNFFNKDFSIFAHEKPIKPYSGMDVNVFYFSITWFPFKDVKSVEKEIAKPDRIETIYSQNRR